MNDRRPDATPPAAEEVAEIYGAAAELEAAERRVLLDEACAGRSELRAEVDSLLAAHDHAAAFLVRAPIAGWRISESAASAAEGLRAGPYRLLSEIGRGGMGTVYLAERADGAFEQRVALKLVRRGFGSEALRARFLHERQILARLEHPNIARLVDGGVTEDDQPYFAMELVRGAPIAAYSDAHRLSIEARLTLFGQACRAVEHAHANLVVHRDLKPSNMLVTGEGSLKLLDFGISRLLDPAAAIPAVIAATGAAPNPSESVALEAMTALTPEYASPEQLRGGPVTTASDVYSLGVVLYELLTGRCPRRFARRGFGVVDEAAAGRPTLPPSEAISRSAEQRSADGSAVEMAPAEVAAVRGTDAAGLRRRLRGDLDAILLRALDAEPERRYRSAESLAADLSRHLAGLPVAARAGTLGYRAAKFVRRHRWGVAAALLIVAALGAGLVTTVWQADRARREADRALAVQRFLVEVFERADPTRSLGETVSAREILDEAARRLRGDTSVDRLVRAELADTLARTYRSLGRLDDAASWSEEAVALFGREFEPAAPRTALALLTRAEVRGDRGQVAESLAALDALLPRLESEFGAGSVELVRARSARAGLLVHSGESELALAEEQAILEDTLRLRGENHVETAAQLRDVAVALSNLSRFPEAVETLRAARSNLERAGASRSPQAIETDTSLAEVLDVVGRDAEAESTFAAVLETGRAVLGARHPQVAQILIKYGFMLGELDRYDESTPMLEEAIAILEPLGHFDAGAAMRYLAFAHQTMERFDAASELFARAERLLRVRLGDDSPMTWAAVVTSAHVDAKRGELVESEARLREAITALERIHGAESNDVRVPRKLLGEVVRLSGKGAEAEAIHRQVLEHERRLFGTDEHAGVASTKYHLALDILESGRPERLAEARRFADESLAYQRAHEPESVRVGELLALSGRIAAAEGDPARARRELSEAIARITALRGGDAPSTRAARRALAALPG